MLTSPISITIAGTAHSLSRINNDNFGSTYLKKAAGLEIRLDIRNANESKSGTGQMERHIMDLQYTTWDVDGKPTTIQTYTHLRFQRGSDPVIASDVAKGLAASVTANIAAIANWES
jgi:hypothetical protein